MYAQNHRSVLNGTPLDDRFTNVAREARRAGYAPTLFGYTDTTVDPRTATGPDDPRLFSYEGVLPGFEVGLNDPSEGAGPLAWGRWLAGRGRDVPSDPRELYRPDRSVPGADGRSEWWAPGHFGPDETETAFLTDHLIDWLDRHGDQPWFLHASILRPHPPYRAARGYHDRYAADDVPAFRGHPTREAEAAAHPLAAVTTRLPGVAAPEDEDDRRQLRATYYGMMAEVDDQLARLFGWLDEAGLAGDTLVVLTSDHGDQMGDHWMIEKLAYWDESYHVPLIVVDPRPEADATWMGLDVPLQCDGRALQPFLHGTPVEGWRDTVHWEWDFRNPWLHLAEDMYGIPMEQCVLNVSRDERWKYVHFGTDPDLLPPLLFDLAADPEQLANVAADPGHAGVVVDRLGEILRWRMRHDERTLTGHMVTPEGLVVRRDPHR
jgi:arylsulfatase A-like enzyme